MPSNHLILHCPLLLPPSIFPNIRVFSSESVLRHQVAKYWSFSFSISPSNEYSGLISFRVDWFDLLAIQGTLKSLLHFLIWSFIFLELSCRSCLYIIEISCLSVASFAIIFSHSEGCLLILLIVSFVVQKLLSLIRSHLFIFLLFPIFWEVGNRGSCCGLCRRVSCQCSLGVL